MKGWMVDGRGSYQHLNCRRMSCKISGIPTQNPNLNDKEFLATMEMEREVLDTIFK